MTKLHLLAWLQLLASATAFAFAILAVFWVAELLLVTP